MISYSIHNQKVSRKGLHLIALSGGSDSVVLFHLLKQNGFRLHAVHCNFLLRGEESVRDMEFCQSLCEKWHTPLTIQTFQTKAYAEKHHVGIEMAARKLRYDAFEKLRKQLRADKIFVGTHQDDLIETLFINMLRSTGIEGLTGIARERNHIVRPLIDYSRSDILEYAEQHQLSYIHDSSNDDEQILRNAIRHRLIPTLLDIAPHAKTSLVNMARNISDVMPLLHQATQKAMKDVLFDNKIDICRLRQQPSPEWILYNILSPLGFSSKTCRQIYESIKVEGEQVWHADAVTAMRHLDQLILLPSKELKPVRTTFDSTGTFPIPHLGVISIEKTTIDKDFVVPREPFMVAVDASTVSFPLTIDYIADGQRFIPFGLKGSKLINDYLADRGVYRHKRCECVVLTDAAGCVVWLPGHTIGHPHRITQQTKEVFLISFRPFED